MTFIVYFNKYWISPLHVIFIVFTFSISWFIQKKLFRLSRKLDVIVPDSSKKTKTSTSFFKGAAGQTVNEWIAEYQWCTEVIIPKTPPESITTEVLSDAVNAKLEKMSVNGLTNMAHQDKAVFVDNAIDECLSKARQEWANHKGSVDQFMHDVIKPNLRKKIQRGNHWYRTKIKALREIHKEKTKLIKEMEEQARLDAKEHELRQTFDEDEFKQLMRRRTKVEQEMENSECELQKINEQAEEFVESIERNRIVRTVGPTGVEI